MSKGGSLWETVFLVELVEFPPAVHMFHIRGGKWVSCLKIFPTEKMRRQETSMEKQSGGSSDTCWKLAGQP